MKNKLAILLSSIFFLFTLYVKSSDSTKLIKYTPDFRFTDGVYITFNQVKNNSPIEKARILTTIDYNDKDFFKRITSENTISYYNNLGKKIDVPLKNIWGFADNGNLYIKVDYNFYKITIIGSICHFIAYITTYDYNNSPYYGYNGYSVSYTPPTEKSDLKEYILDFNTGKRLEYTIKNLEILLIKDEELYSEFVSLSKRKKKQLKYTYIRRFNTRNPIFLPENSLF